MERSVWQKTATDAAGNILEGAQVTVNIQDGGLATIYSAQSGGVPIANPFLTGSDGIARFYAEPGFYSVTLFKDGQQVTFPWNNLGDNNLRQQVAIEFNTFADMQASELPEGRKAVCRERANAEYIVQASGYVALAGDVTFANGLIGALQVENCNDLACYGVKYDVNENQGGIVQSAIDRIRTNNNGGQLEVSGKVYSSQTIYVWERCFLLGQNGMILNWYQSDGTYLPKGSGFKLMTGANVDLIKLAISGNETQGASIPPESNVARRHGGGLSCMYLDGNRSENNNLTAVDLNNLGSPLVCRGVNVIAISDVVVSRGAENNVVFESNGLSDGQCNNMYIHRIYSQGSAGSGFNLAGGDSNIGFLWGAQNGVNGMTSSMSNTTFIACIFNDNSQNGYFSSGENCNFNGIKTYDNRKNGLIISAKNNTVIGGQSRHNGMNAGFPTTDRCGFVGTSSAEGLVVVGHKSYDDGYRGDPLDITQQRGYRLLATTDDMVFEGNYAFGNVISQYSSALTFNKRCYDGLVTNANAFTHSTPVTLSSIAANTLNADKGLITLNVSGGATINAIASTSEGLKKIMIRNINSTPLTFTQSTSLATKSGANLVLGQYQAVSFQEFSSGIWYEV